MSEQEYKYVAIVDKSAGNETVGEMWQETLVIKEDTTVKEIVEWANGCEDARITKCKITLTRGIVLS